MNDNKEDKEWLYGKLKDNGLSISYEDFDKTLSNDEDRKWYYDKASGMGLQVGSYDDFSRMFGNISTEPARQNQAANAPEVNVSTAVRSQQAEHDIEPVTRQTLRQQVEGTNGFHIPTQAEMRAKVDPNNKNMYPDFAENIRQAAGRGEFDTIINKEEEDRLNKTFKPSPVNNQGDIYRNYASRFGNTERGKQLDDELASIQQEVSRRYADQYLQSPEYRQLASQYSGNELDRRANEQFNDIYGKRIQNDIEPYQRAYSNEVMSRYGSNIEKESNELVKKQVGKQLDELSGKVDSMITLRGQQLEKESEGKWWRDLPRGGGGAVTTANFASNQGRSFDPEYQQLQAASSLIDNSKNIINEASKKGKTNFVAGLGRGIRDSFNADNWSFGLTELSKNINLNQVLNKADKGEQLSESEQTLLDALVTNLAVNAYYSSDLGKGYKAGQTTGASIPFMLEFAVNPVSASGSGIAKGILRYGARRFGLASARGAARKAALTGARLVGDAAAAAAMTGTTGLAGVASDTQERMRGDVNIDFDDNGNVVYKDRENRKGLAESAFKSATSRFLENQSEMVFNAFPGIGEAIGKYIPGGMPDILKRFGNTRMGQSVRELYRDIKNNPTLREIAQRTQFHGLGEEYMEEVYNNFASIPLGDMTFEEAVSLDNNIDTFLGLAPTSVAFGMLGLAGMARERYNNRRNMRRAFGKFTPDQQRMFNELQQMSRENGNEDIKNFIKMTIEDPELTQEQKRDKIQYAWEIARSNAIDEVQEEEIQEQVDAENADIDAHSDLKTNTYTEMDRLVMDSTGEYVRVPGHKTGEIGGMPVWVEEGKEVTPENSIVLKPGQWDEGTVRSMPADEVKAENEAMIREEAAAQAEQESTYSPDIPPLQLGSAFKYGNDTYEVVQQNADGGWIANKTSVDEKGNQKEEVVLIDDKTYMDIMQANIDAEEAKREQPEKPQAEVTLNSDIINSATTKDYMKANPFIVEGYITSHPEQVQIRLNDEVRKTADYLNGKTDEKGYLSSIGYLDSYLNNASDEEIRELAKEQSDRYRPYLNINNQNQQSSDDVINSSENNAKNEVHPSEEQGNMSESPVQVQQTEVQPEPIQQPKGQQEEQPQTEVQDTVIPTDEEGNPLYYRAPVDVTVRSISGEGLEPEEVDAFIEANQREADKNLKRIQDKAPKMGTSIAAYKKAKAEWQEKVADAQAQSDYWKQVKDELTAIRTRPGDTISQEIAQFGEPLNGEELAAMMLGNGSLPLLRESYMRELGTGNKEAQGMFGLFASKENGGMTIEEAGERLMEADRENGTHFFDQNDPNAGRNAIIDVLSSARTKGDLARFVQNNRERMAEQERQAEYAAYEDWCESYMHMTVPEYEAYQDYLLENNPYDGVDASELDRVFAEAEQEYQTYLNKSENGQGTTEIGSGGVRGTPERDEQGGEAGVREEGVPVLSGEQPVLQRQVQGRAGGTEERPVETDDVIRDADGNVSENEEGSIDNAIEQQDGENLLDFAERVAKNKEIDDARHQVESNPTDAQKEAGNYKKGHIKLDGYDITIENPKGSVRSGVDENGQPWSVTMNNDYGYIRGTEGVDGDHIDVFLSDSPTLGDVYVIDQVDPDTGEFDEHKVMYGFKSALAAKRAYLANYSTDWKGLGAITKVSKDEFKKWVESSHRKTKPFAEYKSVNKSNVTNETNAPESGFEITPVQYITKRGKVLDMFLVKFADPLSKERERAARELAKTEKGWYDRDKGGFMMRSEESARKLADTITGNEEAVSDAQPLSLADTRKLEEPVMRQVGVEGLMRAIQENGEAKLSDHLVPQSEQKEETSVQETENSEQNEENAYGANNKLVSRDRYEELKKRMRQKFGGQLNMGIDPEILAIGTEMAAYHIEAGARKFADYATHMIADLGDAIRPYLKSFYNGARDLPEVIDAGLAYEMTPYEEVRMFDVANFDKGHSDALATAEMVVQEQEADKQADEAKEKLINKRNEAKKQGKQQRKQEEPKTADLFSAQAENATESQDNSPFQKGDAVVYQGKPATVYDIEDNGRLMLDTGLAPVLYESADPKEVKPANTATHNAENTEINRIFANAVKTDMLAALDSGTKPYRSILDLRKRAAALGMEVDNDGRTDILLQELVEDGLVRAAREVVEQHGRDSRESYDLICKLYDMQPTIAARSSNRIKMQQYSTPLPMAWNAAHFAMSGKQGGKVLEPTAGNGMLVFAVPANQVHVNELDETRLDNLREQGFAQVTQQDATEPFDGGQQYDVVIANPPFGKREGVEYDGKMIPGLDPQITLNALASMKDDGKAAIIIGGNMEYGNNGGLKSMKPFFTYLYDHYNVKGVVDMDGKLYSKQGTTFPTRMILIAGRRSDEERAQTAVYPPVESKAIRKADSFDDLYDIIDEVINSKEKTNGTEILRSQQGQLVSVADQPSRNTDGTGHSEQSRKNDDTGHGQRGTARSTESNSGRSQQVLSREHRTNTGNGETWRGAGGNTEGGSRGISEPDVQRVGTVGVSTERVGLGETRTEQPKKRTLTEEKSAYRPHNNAFSLQSVAPAAMVEAMDNVLSQIEAENGNIDEFVRKELGYDTIEETHQALAAEQVDSVAMAIYQMKKGQALIIGDQTGVGKGRQMAALIRWAVKRGEKPIFITQKADLFSDIYRDLVDIGSGDLVPFIFNSDGAMVDSNGNTVHKTLSSKEMAKVFAAGQLPDEYDFAVLTYSQVNTGDEVSQKEAEEAAKKRGGRTKKSKASKDGKATPKATFLRAIAEDNYLFLDESHTAAGTSNTGAYLQSILRSAKAATFASATFAKRPDTMPLYAIRTAMSQAKVEPDKLIGIIEKGGVTLQEIMSRELTNAGQMVRRERDMSDVVTDWKTINDPATVKRARENYDRTIAAFNAIIKFQEDYVKPMVDAMDKELAVMAESAGIKRGTDKMGVENVPFASKTYNYTKQLMLALKVDAIANEVDAEIKAGRHPVIALESTMESSIKDYSAGEVIAEPTFSASLLRGLDTVMQYTIKDENGKEQHARYSPNQLGEVGEKAYYELQDFIRKSTSDIFISPLDAIIERLHGMGYKVGELTGRNMYVERDDEGRVVVKRRTDKDKKRMQREFNSGELDVLILNKSASTGISLHASEKFSDQRQRTMIIAQPLSDINDYMQMIGRIDRTGQVHRGYYINLGLPVPAENRFLMMLSTKLKSLNANTTTSQDSESNDVEAPDLLNKYGSQVVVEYLRDNPEIYEKMGSPLKKAGQGGGRVQTNELDEYKPQEDDARKITGYVALLTTKEQEEFYDDVVRRYNELIKYLNDTGSNDLKITVMPLRAKTLNKRVSSEGIDPTGANPFARNSYVEQVEMDVLRKPMKAAEIRKTIEQVNKGKRPEDYIRQVIATIEKEDEVRIASEKARYERSKAKAQEDIAKQTEKINRQQKRTAEEKQAAIADYARETNENVETKHNDNMVRLNTNSDMLKQRLHMFEVGKSYLMPDNLESMVFDFSTPAIFCGYKAKDSKITASTTLAVFATLDGRRRMEIKLSQPEALRSIYKTTNDNWDAARSTTLENWDSQIPTGTRKTGFIMTGNILQAIADTQDEHGGYSGQLISYTDIDGNVHDGILMPDKWNTSMLKTSGAPIISRLKQIKDYMPVTSHDGKVQITGSSWAKMYYLTVPKTKKDGAVYYENKTLLRAVNGGNFYPYRGKLRADIPADNIESVVKELSKLGVKVQEEAKESDVMLRNGNGALTDEDLSMANDPVSKLLGRSTRTARQRKAFAEHERERMVERVRELAETMHLDNVYIVTDSSTLQGNRAKAKGFYSRSTGRITIVIPNQTSVFDAEQTLLHEAVAHYGLRQLFGEHFDTFLDNVYRNAEPEVRRKIVELAQKKGWNIANATEEYLASLAEDTNFDDINASWWSKIKELFLRMLHEIGFENFSGVTLSDNELRYILWRSYENLAEPGRYRSILGEAADIVKQNELKVGNYAEGAPTEQNAAEIGDDLYRMAPDGETDDGSREAYNRAIIGNRFKAQEAYQDSMLSLKRLQEVVEKYSGKKLQSFENAYMAENQMSSKNTREKEVYGEKFFKPMIKSVGELMKKGASYGGIIDYMIAKHGLERNEAFAYRDAELQTERRFFDKYKELEKMNDNGLLTNEEYQNRKDKLDSDKESYYQERVEKNLEKDYSGLTALADKHGVDEEEFKKHAEDVVADFENRFDASDLWDKVNSATKETLRKAYESGMMGRDVYNKVRGQFKYYIPLRGWDETTAEDVYEYLNSETSPVNSVLKSAKGRKSLADDPFATIGNMAESTIHQGNRNLMKQNFLNMAINHPTDVLTVKEAWYVKDTETGDWKMSFPDIKAGDSSDVIADKIEEHEQRMKELENNGESTKVKEGLNIDYRIGARQAREHIVTIKRNGKDYLVFVNGNPRAAQAVNGLTNPDADENKLLAGISRFNRELAANFTNRNPAFVLSNLARDLIFSVSAVSIKESPEYSRKFAKNIIRSMRVIARNLRGKGDPQHNQDDALFEEFLANGGETGYTMMHSVDEYKKMVKRELGKKEITGKTDYFSAVRACAQFFSTMNRWAEDVSRFTAYMTSKESGRPVMQSVNDAKEITVNFNRRGAGSKTSGVFGWTSGMFRNLYLFFNAGIQSLSNFGRLAKKNPKAFTTALAGFTAAGFIVPVLNGLFISLLGDGDDDYYGNLPDWVRKNNLCLFIPGTKGKFITIPLPIELRAFYGLGEMAYQETIGKEGSSGGQIAYKAINQITELLPLNPLGNNGDIAATIMPDVLSPIWQAYDNKDFTGKPVYRKNAFNENMPEWTKAYNSTADWLVDLSEWTNEIAGGDKYKRGELLMSNWNPAIVEHLFESYFGGMAKTFNQTAKTLAGGVESAVKGEWSDELQWYSTPVLNRFINDASDDRSSFGKVNQRYYKLYEQFEETGKLIRGYSNEVSKGNLDYLEKLDGLYRSDDYKTYLVFKRGKRLVDRIREMEKSLPEGDSKERKALQEQSVKIKRSLIDAVENVAGD